jgi:thioredoxin 1
MVKMLKFGAPWCGPCKMIEPIIESIKKEYTSEDFEVYSYNVDESPELVSMYSIRSVPTIIFLKDEDEVERIIGLTNKRDLETQIKKHL